MDNKLRECPICGEMELLFSLVDYNTKNGHTGCRTCGISVTQSTIHDSERTWNTRHDPKHETVQQWEERTGETYPDNGPVWLFQLYPEIEDSWWSLQEYGAHKGWQRARKDSGLTEGELKIIIATHHGKPDGI